jgi:hypothetical protein
MVGQVPDNDDEFVVTHITSGHRWVDLPRTINRDDDSRGADVHGIIEHRSNRSDHIVDEGGRRGDSKIGHRHGDHRSDQMATRNGHS